MARKHRTPPTHQRYVAKLRAAGLMDTFVFLPRPLVDQLATLARQHRVSRSIALEAALSTGLRLTTPSAIQRTQLARQRLSGGPCPSVPLTQEKQGNG